MAFNEEGTAQSWVAESEGAREFTREEDVSNFRDAQPIKRMLAVLVFDVLGPSWIDQPVELEVNR